LVRLTVDMPASELSSQTDDLVANVLAAYLRVLLWQRRDQDVTRGVRRALEAAPEELQDLIPPQPPVAPDPFDWQWPKHP